MNIHYNHKSHCFDGKFDSVHHHGKYIYIVDNCEHNTLVAIEMTECLCSIIACGDNIILYYLTVDLFEVIDLERLDGLRLRQNTLWALRHVGFKIAISIN